MLNQAKREMRLALRRLRRKPLFVVGSCLQLGLAIGGATALFSVMNAVLFRTLPLRDAGAVVSLHVVRDGTDRGVFSLPMFLRLSASHPTLSGVAAYFQWSANLTDAGDAERLQAMRVSGNYLDVLGGDAALGRTMTARDGAAGSPPTVMLSDALWKRRFGRSTGVVGQTLRLNGEPFTVIGVLRPDFPFQVREAELIASWAPGQDPRRTSPAVTFLRLAGRLAAGSSLQQAQSALNTQIADFRRVYPDATAADRGGRVVTLQDDVIGSINGPLKMLAAAMVLLLLIAAANLTNLLLIDGWARRQEFATRRSLGASTGRVIGQLFAEAAVLAGTGALTGIALAAIAVRALLALADSVLPRTAELALDRTSIAFAVLLAAGVTLLTGVLPALQLSNPRQQRLSQRTVTLGGRRWRAAFVCAEVALSVLLIIEAGLLVRSFAAIERVRPGFEPSGVVSLRLSLPRAHYPSTASLTRFYDALAPRIGAMAGVSGVAAANVVPLNGYLATTTIDLPSVQMTRAAELPEVHYRMISPGLVPVLGGVLAGAACALAASRELSASLYGVTAYDPLTFASVVSLVAAVGTLALYLPARHLARLDPVVALKAE